MPVTWIMHEGRRILYSDYRDLKDEKSMLYNLKLEEETYEKTSHQILCLNDYRGAYGSSAFMKELKEVGKRQKGKTLRSAILGVSGAKRILLNAFSSITGESVQAFDDEKKAMEYLVKS